MTREVIFLFMKILCTFIWRSGGSPILSRTSSVLIPIVRLLSFVSLSNVSRPIMYPPPFSVPLHRTTEARAGNTTRRSKALSSGAQLVSTDYPSPLKPSQISPSIKTGYQVTSRGMV